MAIQGNNQPISFSDVKDEFGGVSGTTISLSDYYAGGDFTTFNNYNFIAAIFGGDVGVPTSGTIDLSDFYGAAFKYAVDVECIGGGGAGGSGWITANRGTDGGDTTVTFASGVVVSSDGGTGGRGAIQTGWGTGSSSYYGSGGAGGTNSDFDGQTAGDSAPSSSYGAGGGGGGANTFASRNGGEGGYSGGTQLAEFAYTVYAWNSSSRITRYTGQPTETSTYVAPEDDTVVVIGAKGTNVRPDAGTDGGFGANGYAKLTFRAPTGSKVEEFTSGTTTYTAPLRTDFVPDP